MILEVQRSIFNVLTGDATLRQLLATHADAGSPTMPAVYDVVPQSSSSEDDTVYPYVELGEFTAGEFDTDDINGLEQTVTLHIWDRNEGRGRAKQVHEAVYNALQNVQLEVIGAHAIYCYFEFSESIPDPDVLTQHLVMRFRIVTQQH